MELRCINYRLGKKLVNRISGALTGKIGSPIAAHILLFPIDYRLRKSPGF